MKVKMLQVDSITWLFIESTYERYLVCKEWCERIHHSWIIIGDVTPSDLDPPDYNPDYISKANAINRWKFVGREPDTIVSYKFGFRDRNDALRFRLST